MGPLMSITTPQADAISKLSAELGNTKLSALQQAQLVEQQMKYFAQADTSTSNKNYGTTTIIVRVTK
jgi:hypothetical protein